MRYRHKTALKLLAIALVAAAFLSGGFAQKGRAQTTTEQVLLTWRAATYTPLRYAGKALPTVNSIINFSVDVLKDGAPVNLSKQDIYWYVNDELFSGGAGKQRASLLMNSVIVTPPEIRVQIGTLSKAIRLPIVYPEAVIETPYPNSRFTANTVHAVGAPYFFAASSPSTLNFSWSINGETASSRENPADLTVTLNSDAPTGSTVNMGLVISNAQNSTEAASDAKTLTLVK